MSDGGDVLHLLVIAQAHLDIIRGQLAAAPERGVVAEQGRSGQFAVSIFNLFIVLEFHFLNISIPLTCGALAEESRLGCRSVFSFGWITVTALTLRPPLSLRFVLYSDFVFTHGEDAQQLV